MKKNIESGIENVNPVTGVFTEKELIDHIYQGERIPVDNKFMSDTHGGVFKYFDLMTLLHPDKNKPERFFPYVKIKNEYVGLAQLEQSYQNSKVFWISFISVDPHFQNKGLASKLIVQIMMYAKENNLSLQTSSYSDEGFEKLEKVLHREASQFGVTLLDFKKML